MNANLKGFTLIELVITLTISVIVATFAASFITSPILAFSDQARRAELVDSAESALGRIGRDIQRALPNSVRIASSGSISAIEILNVVDGVRYRAGPPPGDPDARLSFDDADEAFNSIGSFNAIAKPFSSTAHYLSVYNVGVAGANAYELTNVITPAGTQIDIDGASVSGEDNVQLTPPFQFAYASPRQRIFLVDTPVSFLCDLASGELTRYDGYAITANQSDHDSAVEMMAAGAGSALLADNITGCAFAYAAGTSQRAGLVTLSLTISDSGESIALMHQVHVVNAP